MRLILSAKHVSFSSSLPFPAPPLPDKKEISKAGFRA